MEANNSSRSLQGKSLLIAQQEDALAKLAIRFRSLYGVEGSLSEAVAAQPDPHRFRSGSCAIKCSNAF